MANERGAGGRSKSSSKARTERSGKPASGQSRGSTGRSGKPASGKSRGSSAGRGSQASTGRAGGSARTGSGSGRGRATGASAVAKAQRSSGAPRTGARQGGFGPFATDDRDERTREKRNERRDDRDEKPRPRGRPVLRTVGTRQRPAAPRTRRPAPRAPTGGRRRKPGPADVELEIRRLAGRNGEKALRALMEAADAFAADRERDALRILNPWRKQLADAPSIRELVGLCQYRLGNYAAAAKELEAYSELSGAVDQNPVLMDCYRAQHRWRKVEERWDELAAVSPSADAVAEGRIVYAGALADQGNLSGALNLLRKRSANVRDPKEYHLRLWYALADLEERAGNNAVARDLFDRVRRAEPGYADVAERRAALG
jgi:tetratricopeptide (TPR) repeat protein